MNRVLLLALVEAVEGTLGAVHDALDDIRLELSRELTASQKAARFSERVKDTIEKL